MACKDPQEYDIALTHWSTRLLSYFLGVLLNIKISVTSVQTILQKAEIKVHRMKYYLKCKDPDLIKKSRLISRIYQTKLLNKWEIFCFDEKTGMQILERKAPNKKVGKGTIAKREHEYIRHGTLSLLAGFNVRTGKVLGKLQKRHTQFEFIEFLKYLRKNNPRKKLLIILDNLSSHKTPNVEKWLSTQINSKGEKMIRLVFLPKHASWLNQVEIWFSNLAYHCVKFGNNSCTEYFKKFIYTFIEQYNERAKPYAWTFKGLPLVNKG